MSVHICAPVGATYRTVRRCRRCRTRRRLIITIYEWYGAEVTCCTCGARVSDGWLRPAKRGDVAAAAKAAALWPTLPNLRQVVRNGLPWLDGAA